MSEAKHQPHEPATIISHDPPHVPRLAPLVTPIPPKKDRPLWLYFIPAAVLIGLAVLITNWPGTKPVPPVDDSPRETTEHKPDAPTTSDSSIAPAPQRKTSAASRVDGLARVLFGPIKVKADIVEEGKRYYSPISDSIELSLTVLSRNPKARQLSLSRPKAEDWRPDDFGSVTRKCFHQGGGPFNQSYYVIRSGPLTGAWLYWSVKDGDYQPDVEVTLETEIFARADEGAQNYECATRGEIRKSSF